MLADDAMLDFGCFSGPWPPKLHDVMLIWPSKVSALPCCRDFWPPGPPAFSQGRKIMGPALLSSHLALKSGGPAVLL